MTTPSNQLNINLYNILIDSLYVDNPDIFFKLSKDGLEKRNFTNLRNNNDTQYLKSIESMIKKKSTRAEDVVKNLK